MRESIHLGYEVGTGEPVEVPLRHLAVTGQTQESGKTTTLEALVARAGAPAIAFVTKRGERSFAGGHRLQPYFRDRADWQFVTSLLDATLQEKNKFLRPWIMKICRATRTLADVHREVKKALAKATGINEGVYTQLDAYLELIVPEIARAPLAPGLALRPGLNVMDVSGHATPMQMLFVQSAIDWVNQHERGVVTIVPEAWEFIPEGKGSPVKASAVSLVRKGAGLGNWIWVDSQDMAGVDKVVLRGCTVWLIGVQREANEIKRNLANIPAGIQRPKPGDIARLDRGQFYACWKDRTVKVYVQPAWVEADVARRIALGERVTVSPPQPETQAESSFVKPALQKRTHSADEDPMSKAVEEKLDKLLDFLARGQAAQAAVDRYAAPQSASALPFTPEQSFDLERIYQAVKARLIEEAPNLLRVLATRPELEVLVERQVIQVDGNTLKGRLAQLIAGGFFDDPKTGNATFEELKRRGFGTAKPNVYREADKLAEAGFLTKEDGGYLAVKEMKVNVVRK